MLEYEGGAVSHLYRWHGRDDDISGPWFDEANRSLWVLHNGVHKLMRFDGKAWNTADVPVPKEGYTRGDMLSGFRGISAITGFWLQGGNHVWRWEPGESNWVRQDVPTTWRDLSFIPLKDRKFLIFRDKYYTSSNADSFHYLQDNQWQEFPSKSGIKFFTENIALSREAAYILAKGGKLVRLTTSDITPIETLGEVEAMTVTTAGHLLVGVRNKGIYEYSDQWQQRFSSPYPSTEAEHWAYLAESAGQVAFAITAKPKIVATEKWKHPGQTTLWISKGDQLKAISIEALKYGATQSPTSTTANVLPHI